MINLIHIWKKGTIVLAVVLSLSATIVWAAPPVGVEEDGQYEPVTRVNIKKKMIDAVITNTGEAYAVDEQTIIVGMDGAQVNIRKLLVPCEAEITYDTRRGKRIARRITVTDVGVNATWQWISRQPE